MTDKNQSFSLSNLEVGLEPYFTKKAPFQIPDGAKEFIVQYGPWIMIVLSVLALPALLAAIGLGTFLAPLAVMGGVSPLIYVSVIISLIGLVVTFLALPGLLKRKMQGWRLLFYSQLISLVGGVVSMSGLVGALIGAVIGFYILFQVKEKYSA